MAALTLLAELQKHDLSSRQLKVFAGYLVKYPIGDVRRAINGWCEKNKWFPMPSELITAVKDIQRERSRRMIQIPDNLKSFDEQAEINKRGIALMRAALKGKK
jgi:hypothetical protein